MAEFSFRTVEDIVDEEITALGNSVLNEKHKAKSTVNNTLILLTNNVSNEISLQTNLIKAEFKKVSDSQIAHFLWRFY